MKPLYLLLIFTVLITHTSISSDWDIFPYQQKSFYNTSGNRIIQITQDSVSYNEDTLHFYLNAFLPGNTCGFSRLELGVLSDTILGVDSGFVTELNYNMIINQKSGPVNFEFRTNSKPGEDWEIKGTDLMIRHESSDTLSFLSIADSVKKYIVSSSNPSDKGILYVLFLSKTYELITFPDFSKLLDDFKNAEIFDLVGFESEKQKKGFALDLPGFEEYFHLNAGDILLWNYHSTDFYYQKSEDYYYKDSIFRSYISTDTVIYEISRTYESSKTEYIKQVYLKDDFKHLVNVHINYGCYSNFTTNGHYENILFHWMLKDYSISDSISTLTFEWNDAIESPDCHPAIIEGASICSLDTRYGIMYENFWDPFGLTITRRLAGSDIDGVKDGITTLPKGTGVDDNNIDSDIKIYPNPFTDRINIKSDFYNNIDYKIYDIYGRLIQQGKTTEDIIDTNNLTTGVYNLVLHNRGKTVTKKIIKN